jgi:hypothetical protein
MITDADVAKFEMVYLETLYPDRHNFAGSMPGSAHFEAYRAALASVWDHRDNELLSEARRALNILRSMEEIIGFMMNMEQGKPSKPQSRRPKPHHD